MLAQSWTPSICTELQSAIYCETIALMVSIMIVLNNHHKSYNVYNLAKLWCHYRQSQFRKSDIASFGGKIWLSTVGQQAGRLARLLARFVRRERQRTSTVEYCETQQTATHDWRLERSKTINTRSLNLILYGLKWLRHSSDNVYQKSNQGHWGRMKKCLACNALFNGFLAPNAFLSWIHASL